MDGTIRTVRLSARSPQGSAAPKPPPPSACLPCTISWSQGPLCSFPLTAGLTLSGSEGESSSEAQTHTACSPPWAAPRPKPSQGQTLGAHAVHQAQSTPVAQTPSLASLAEGGWTGSLGGMILVGPPRQKFQEQGWGSQCGRPVGALASQWGLAPKAVRGVAQGRGDFRGKGGWHNQHSLPSRCPPARRGCGAGASTSTPPSTSTPERDLAGCGPWSLPSLSAFGPCTHRMLPPPLPSKGAWRKHKLLQVRVGASCLGDQAGADTPVPRFPPPAPSPGRWGRAAEDQG